MNECGATYCRQLVMSRAVGNTIEEVLGALAVVSTITPLGWRPPRGYSKCKTPRYPQQTPTLDRQRVEGHGLVSAIRCAEYAERMRAEDEGCMGYFVVVPRPIGRTKQAGLVTDRNWPP